MFWKFHSKSNEKFVFHIDYLWIECILLSMMYLSSCHDSLLVWFSSKLINNWIVYSLRVRPQRVSSLSKHSRMHFERWLHCLKSPMHCLRSGQLFQRRRYAVHGSNISVSIVIILNLNDVHASISQWINAYKHLEACCRGIWCFVIGNYQVD